MSSFSNGLFSLADNLIGKLFGGFIICWHDLSSDIFIKQVESLYPAKPIPLKELVKRHTMGLSTQGLFAMTFDDGVGETVRNISQTCIKKGWPVTFYIPTDYIDNGVMPFQKLGVINDFLPNDEYLLPNNTNKEVPYKLNKDQIIELLSRSLYTERLEFLNHILNFYIDKISELKIIDNIEDQYPKPIEWAEISKYSKYSNLSFQSHGASHAAVVSLNNNEIENEMLRSKNIIQENTNRDVHSFCYPYGASQSISKEARILASKYFDSAVTLLPARLRNANPYYLPRIDLYEKNSALVSRLKVFR